MKQNIFIKKSALAFIVLSFFEQGSSAMGLKVVHDPAGGRTEIWDDGIHDGWTYEIFPDGTRFSYNKNRTQAGENHPDGSFVSRTLPGVNHVGPATIYIRHSVSENHFSLLEVSAENSADLHTVGRRTFTQTHHDGAVFHARETYDHSSSRWVLSGKIVRPESKDKTVEFQFHKIRGSLVSIGTIHK